MGVHEDRLERYLERLALAPDAQLRRLTEEGRADGFPIVGPQVGRFLEQMARALGARRIFELGSGFGYSTLWFARALPPDGVIPPADGDAANGERARRELAAAGLDDRVRFHVGNAIEILRGLDDPEPFDIVFCDIDKHGYPEAWATMRQRVRVGGLILIDNLIWDGKVADLEVDDADTAAIRRYHQLAWQDEDFLSSLLPIRDGIGVHLRLR